jgi:hypothetical protein
VKANSGTITNGYGVYASIVATGAVTNRYGVYVADTGSGANYYNIYSAGNGKNYFSGPVGIGVTAPAAKLDVTDASTTTSAIIVPRAGAFTGTTANGMIRYNSTSNLFEFFENGSWVNYTTVSDERLKTNVVSVDSKKALDIVKSLNPVFYDWDKNNPRTQSFDDKHQVGFIAQQVEKILPEVVNVGEDSYRSVEYGKIVSVVVAAMKELELENVELKKRAKKMEKENADFRKRLEAIEKSLR